MLSLGEIAEYLGAQLHGDAGVQVDSLGTLQSAQPGQLSFLANPRYRSWLEQTRASAVLCRPDQQPFCPVAALVVDDPYLAFARISHRFDSRPRHAAGVHPSALVANTAQLGDSVSLGPNVVVEEGAVLGDGCVVMANSVIGAGSKLGARVTVWPNVTICHGVVIGDRTNIHPGAVIGSDGFGFAPSPDGWHKVAQVGGVRIGNDVDIGAGTTVDRGAIDDTFIGDGVIIDNQVQVAHNVRIGAHTAIAGKAGIAGSVTIGERCLIAGAVGISGHLEITDDVQVMAMTLVTKSITEPGVYASGQPADRQDRWRRNTVRSRQLDDLFSRVSVLEKQAKEKGEPDGS